MQLIVPETQTNTKRPVRWSFCFFVKGKPTVFLSRTLLSLSCALQPGKARLRDYFMGCFFCAIEKFLNNIGDGEIFTDNFQRLDPNLNPIPFRTKEMMQGRKRFEIFDPAPSEQKSLALIVGSRGCDYGCKFCLSSSMFPSDNHGSRIRYRDIGNIVDEINECKSRFGTNALFFVDLNFYGGNTERIRELCAALSKTGINWYAMSRVDASPETFEEMKKGGCLKVGLGIESLVKPLKSGVNLSKDKWQEFVQERTSFLRDLGILSKGYFILDDYSETEKDIDEETEAIQEAGLDEIRLSFMIYSPGTAIFDKLVKDGGFVTTDFSKFSTDYPVIKNPDLTPEKLLAKRKEIYKRFYASDRMASRVKQTLTKFPNLNKSYFEFNNLLIENLGCGLKN